MRALLLCILIATPAFAADPPKADAKPDATKPDAAKPDAAKPDAAKPDDKPPPPAAELLQLKALEGKWKCTGKTVDTPFGAGHPTVGTMDLKSDLNGYWRSLRYEEKKSKENPTPYAMTSYIGFDGGKKQLLRTDIDNLGMVSHLASKGFEGDAIVFQARSWARKSCSSKTR